MLSHDLRVVYLHGFASSPRSRKAGFFAEKLAAEGISVEIPTLDEGQFERLSITRQLRLLDRSIGDLPVVLIGSSLGGYLAALYAALHSTVARLLLLAPAFRFHDLWTTRMNPRDLAAWKEAGCVPIFHYGEAREMSIGYELIADAAQYAPEPDFRQPALIFHGTRDTSVPVEFSADFVRSHANARLIRMDSGHELTDVLEQIWERAKGFLINGLAPN
jgi:pimeloyl-ACP methyl ester carboxylesterase